jgi:hypothetical protein
MEEKSSYPDIRPLDGVDLTPVDGGRAPGPMDPVITMTAIQRFVETERARNRRSLLHTSLVLLGFLLVVLVVFASVAIFMVRGMQESARVVDALQVGAVNIQAELGGASNRMNGVEASQMTLREEMRQAVERQQKAEEQFRSDMSRFGNWLESRMARKSADVAMAAMEERVRELEAGIASGRKEVASYKEMLAGLTNRLSMTFAGIPAGESAESPAKLQPVGDVDPEAFEWLDASNFLASVQPRGVQEVRVTTYPTGDRYEGQMDRGLMNGWGVFVSTNGDRYEGLFKDDMKNNRGVLVTAAGDRYVGEFKDDMKQGRGSLWFASGDRYTGEFANNLMHGKGVLIYQNGNRYVGDLRAGLRHGNGKFTFANGDVYQGAFANDQRNGGGSYQFGDGSRYIGQFKEGKRHGWGRYVYPGGEEFEGEFNNGQKNGYGVFVYPNGKVVKGWWTADQFVKAESPPKEKK